MEKPSALSLPDNSCFLIPTQWDPDVYDMRRRGAGAGPALPKNQPQKQTSKKMDTVHKMTDVSQGSRTRQRCISPGTANTPEPSMAAALSRLRSPLKLMKC